MSVRGEGGEQHGKRLLVRFPEPIFTRVTTPTKQWLDDRALQDGTSVAAFARRILEREAQRDLRGDEAGEHGCGAGGSS